MEADNYETGFLVPHASTSKDCQPDSLKIPATRPGPFAHRDGIACFRSGACMMEMEKRSYV